jgi:membrane-associated phospholipid phosphatase
VNACRVATVTDLTIGREWPSLGIAGLAFPVLIAVSALKTKQHYIVDVLPGAVLGAVIFWAWSALAINGG